jgi:phosphoenolpyruvate carboxylase
MPSGPSHLEITVLAILLASAPVEPNLVDVPAKWRQALDVMAADGQNAYRGLVDKTPGFVQFWQEVTPIDETKRLHIGSRPAVRSQIGAV